MEKIVALKKAAVTCVVLVVLCLQVHAQVYPPTITRPVTFYDFHSDGSNPDFNPGLNVSTVLPGMVLPTLDANGFPVGTTTYFYSWGIGKWFRPWKQSLLGQGSDFARPAYGNGGKVLISVNTTSFDTSYKNVMIQDSLVFNLVDNVNGVYQFQSANFFPLDNRGFGADYPTINFDGNPLNRATNTHNYSFSMYMKTMFHFRPGLTFIFEGDDDLWVFVNGQLVLDLGGLHGTTVGQFTLDAMASQLGLVQGDSATLDVFYCERQAVGSDIKITTNIVASVQQYPSGPHLIPIPSPSIDARPVFSWNSIPNSSTYTLQIDTVASFSSPMYLVPVNDTFYRPSVSLPIDTIYWRVKGDSTLYSATGSFVVSGDIAGGRGKARSIGTMQFVNIKKSANGIAFTFNGYDRGEVSAIIYSVKGQLVTRLKASDFGQNMIAWDYRDRYGKHVTNGLYLMEIKAGAKVIKQRILVAR
jgi:fibro-slime domain-containing protein